jgi:hypothetical protein
MKSIEHWNSQAIQGSFTVNQHFNESVQMVYYDQLVFFTLLNATSALMQYGMGPRRRRVMVEVLQNAQETRLRTRHPRTKTPLTPPPTRGSLCDSCLCSNRKSSGAPIFQTISMALYFTGIAPTFLFFLPHELVTEVSLVFKNVLLFFLHILTSMYEAIEVLLEFRWRE